MSYDVHTSFYERPMSTGMKLLRNAHFEEPSRVVPSSEAPGSKKEEDQVADTARGLRNAAALPSSLSEAACLCTKRSLPTAVL